MDQTQLEGYIHEGEWDEIENYIATGGDVNIQNGKGNSLLHFAVEKQKYEIIQLLLDHGANINIQNNTGKSPLHFAVDKYINSNYGNNFNEEKIIKFLVRKGADVYLLDEDYETPLDKMEDFEHAHNTNEMSGWMEFKYNQLNPVTLALPVAFVPPRNIPPDSSNAISYDNIKEGNVMVNFHDEFKQGRYYKTNTYDKLKEKINPYTRVPITEVKAYKAHIVGGKRKTRKMKKAKKTKAKKGNKRTRKH